MKEYGVFSTDREVLHCKKCEKNVVADCYVYGVSSNVRDYKAIF